MEKTLNNVETHIIKNLQSYQPVMDKTFSSSKTQPSHKLLNTTINKPLNHIQSFPVALSFRHNINEEISEEKIQL